MHRIKHKYTLIKVVPCLLVAALVLSKITFPKASATDDSDYFSAEGSTLRLDVPDVNRQVTVTVKAERDMKLHGLDGFFTPTDSDDPNLYLRSIENAHASMIGYCNEIDYGWFSWNNLECPDPISGDDGIDIQAGEALFTATYDVKSDTTIMKRDLPISITYAEIDEGSESGIIIENIDLDATVAVSPNEKDILSISGINNQFVYYTGLPVVLEGTLTLEANPDNLTVDDIVTTYYEEDGVTEIERPSEKGNYVAKYTLDSENYIGELEVEFTIYEPRIFNINVDIEGNGSVEAPATATGGETIQIKVIPDEGNELLYLEVDGEDVTEELEDNIYEIVVGRGDIDITAFFQPVFDVTVSNNGKYVASSEEELVFTIDAEFGDFTEAGLVLIDDEAIDDWAVDEDAKTITLPANFLATLELGEHTFEAIFTEPDAGVARATFEVVEQSSDEESDDSTLIPNTGISTANDGGAKTFEIISLVVVIVAIVGYLLRKHLKSSR